MFNQTVQHNNLSTRTEIPRLGFSEVEGQALFTFGGLKYKMRNEKMSNQKFQQTLVYFKCVHTKHIKMQ